MIIYAALIMALLLLSVASIIYLSLTTYRKVRREYVEGIINNIDVEFEKVLRLILADATQLYNETAVIDQPRAYAHEKFSFWVKALIAQLSQLGVNANITLPNIELQPNKTVYNQSLEARYVNNLLKMYWYSIQSLSAIAARIDVDAPQLGFYGWSKTILILLNVSIDLDSITQVRRGSDLYTAVNVYVNKEYGLPVENLYNESFRVKYFDTSVGRWLDAEISAVENNGGGNYTLLLSKQAGGPLPSETEKILMLWVEDRRGIVVELYTYDHIDYVVREDAISQYYPDYPKTKQVYVFEVLMNGTWLWLNRPLPSPGTYPIPIPPVKQLRVYSTIHGVDDPNMVELPSQVEEWTPDYKRPTLRFADWRKRFGPGDKLVFIVPFNETGVRRQKIRIKWFHDADTPPPTYKIQISLEPPFAYIDNGVYKLQLVANPGYSDWIDWSISLHANDYHVEYTLYGYDVYEMRSGYWFPMKLPGGDWQVLVGPIRAIAYRENNIVVVPPLDQSIEGELYHRELIIVPYGVDYFLYFGYFYWNKTTTLDYRYLTLFGQISGTPDDVHTSKRMKYASIQLSDPNEFITGNFTTYNPRRPWLSNVMHRWRAINDAGNFGYWAAQYNNYNGQIMFTNEETYTLLTTNPYSSYSEVWAWSTYDYARRVLSYDLLTWDGSRNYKINAGTEMKVFFAGMIYNGGYVSQPYEDDYVWNDGSLDNGYPLYYVYPFRQSTGGELPQVYYRMFLESYIPVIESISY